MPPRGAQGVGRRSPTSRAASLVLTVLGALLVLAGTLALYADREIFDSKRFADHAVSALDDQSVRDAVARQVSRAITRKASPDLVAVEALIEPVAAAIIGTEAFRSAFREGVQEAHAIALGRGEKTAVVRAANIGAAAATALESLSPRVAREIPSGLDARLLSLGDSGAAREATRLAERVSDAAIVLPLLAVLAFAGAIILAGDRRRAITRTGGAIAIAGLVAVLAYFAGEALVGAQGADELDEEALRGLWSALLGDLRDWSLALAAIGAVMAGAGAAVLRPVDAVAPLRRLSAIAATTPASQWLRGLRALAFLAAGLVMVLEPTFVLRAVVVLAGLLVISIAVGELIRLTLPPPEEAETSRAHGRRLAGALVIGLGCVAVVIVATLVIVRGDEDEGVAAQRTGACNGDAALCDRPLDEVVFPATHNAMSAADYPGYLFPMHDRTIARQLADGVRALLVDAYYGVPGRRVYTDFDRSPSKLLEKAQEQLGPEFVAAANRIRGDIARPSPGAKSALYLCHGFCELGAVKMAEALRDVESFLATRPEEVVMIVIEDYVDPADIVAAFDRAGLADYAYTGPLDPLPTLGELVKSGERLIVLAENRAGSAPWYRLAYDYFQETPFDFSTPAEMSCEANRGARDNPLFLINNWINTDPAARPSNAAKVNARGFLSKRARRCARERGLAPNLIAVDFYREGDLLGVSEKLNREPAGAGG